MKNILFALSIFAFLLTACGEDVKDTTKETNEAQQFGATTTMDNAVPFAQLTTQMAGQDSLETKVVGTVESVCQKKGCWVNIVSDGTEQEMFVKFKDYGFFLPKDIAGRQVVLDGFAFREVTPVDELRHYAEDEGKSEEEIAMITEPKEELKFMAAGVLLLPEK